MIKLTIIFTEITALLICVIFGYKWAKNPSGNYEPWLFLAGLIFVALEIVRRYREELFSKEGKIASVIPWVKHWLSRPIIVPHQRPNWWHMGKTGEQKPAMQVVSYWYVTNQSDIPIKILNAYIKNPLTYGHVLTKDINSPYHGSYPVPALTTTDLHADFWITPPIKKEGKRLKLDIVFVDQYGQKRTIKNVVFESDKKKKATLKSLEAEAIYQLEHDIEKKIASVLKDEISRYKKYGRRSGELGSIYANCSGGKIKSIYQDSWTDSKSGERQEIVVNTEKSRIYSENGDALVSFYNEKTSEDERELFVNALVSRLSKQKEYY